MTMTDAERTALHNKLTDVLGTREASKLMEHLPPIRWDQLATKDDLKASEERLGARIDGTNVRLDGTNARLDETNVRLDGTNARLHEMSMQLSEFRGEFAEFRGEIRGGFTEMRSEFTAIGGEFTAIRGEFHLALAKHFRQTIFDAHRFHPGDVGTGRVDARQLSVRPDRAIAARPRKHGAR